MKKFVCLPTTAKIGCKEIFASGRANFTMSSCRIPSIKDVKRLAQPRADKFVQNAGKVREVKTFPDELAYTPKWLVAEHRLDKGCEVAWSNTRKFMYYLLLRKSDERRFS